jgi:hypothetical protein
MAVLAFVFFFFYLLETRGRTLEGMGKLFGVTDEDGLEPEDALREKKQQLEMAQATN